MRWVEFVQRFNSLKTKSLFIVLKRDFSRFIVSVTVRFENSKCFYLNLFRTDVSTKCLKRTKSLPPLVIIGFAA